MRTRSGVATVSASASLVAAAFAFAPERRAAPAITALQPNIIVAKTRSLSLGVIGSGFDYYSKVIWNGSVVPTIWVSSTRLTAQLDYRKLATPGTASVAVVTTQPDSVKSNAMTMTIGNMAPRLLAVTPNVYAVTGEPRDLLLYGVDFVPGTVARWNGSAVPTTFVDSMNLRIAIPAAALATVQSVAITAFSPPPLGGETAPLTFSLELIAPTVNFLAPASYTALPRTVDMTVQLSGRDFVPSSVVRWNGADLQTRRFSQFRIEGTIPAAALMRPGYADVSVRVSVPGAGTRESAVKRFTIEAPAPTISSSRPVPLIRHQTSRVTFTGASFLPAIAVSIGGSRRRVAFVDSTRIQVLLDSADVSRAGPLALRFDNPAPTAGPGSATVIVENPDPVLTAIAPQTALVGGRAFTLMLTGRGFVPESVVRVNGAPRLTQFVSSTELRAGIPASDLTAIGSLAITATSPPPGGGATTALKLSRLQSGVRVP